MNVEQSENAQTLLSIIHEPEAKMQERQVVPLIHWHGKEKVENSSI